MLNVYVSRLALVSVVFAFGCGGGNSTAAEEGSEPSCGVYQHYDSSRKKCVDDDAVTCGVGQHYVVDSQKCVDDEVVDDEVVVDDTVVDDVVVDDTEVVDCLEGEHYDAELDGCVLNVDGACPPGMNYDEGADTCTSMCVSGTVYDPTLDACVEQCGPGQHYEYGSDSCEDTCPFGSHYEPSIQGCIRDGAIIIEEPVIVPRTEDVVLAMAGIPQGQFQWCWAADITMVARYYGTSTYGMCDLASARAGYNFGYCCDAFYAYNDPVCNQPAQPIEIQMGFAFMNVTSSLAFDQLSEDALMLELRMRRPVVNGFSNSAAGHVIVVHGFHKTGSQPATFNVYDSLYNRESLVTFEQLQLYPSPAGYMEWAMTFHGLAPQ